MENGETFFLDIFNHLLEINKNKILIIFDVNANIWFSFKDIIKSLEYVNIDNAISTITISKDNKIKYNQLRPLHKTYYF